MTRSHGIAGATAADGAAARGRLSRRRLAAAAVASVCLHLLLARGLSVTSLGIDGAAPAARAAPQRPKPQADFAIRVPRAAARRPAHERPLEITAPRPAAEQARPERTAEAATAERRPDEPAPATRVAAPPSTAAPRPRDLAPEAAAAPARAASAPAPGIADAAAAAISTSATRTETALSPAAAAATRDTSAAVASRWRPREVALLERLTAPAATSPGFERDDDADLAAPAGRRGVPDRRRTTAPGPAAATVTVEPAAAAAADRTGSTPAPADGPRRRDAPAPSAFAGLRRSAGGPAEGEPVDSPGPTAGAGGGGLASLAPPGRGGAAAAPPVGSASAPGRVPLAAAAAAAAAGAGTASAVAVEQVSVGDRTAEPTAGPRAVGRAAAAGDAERTPLGLARNTAADPDAGEELSVPQITAAAAAIEGPRRDDAGPAAGAPRPLARVGVVALPAETRVRDVAEAFTRRGRDARAERRVDPRATRADAVVDRGLEFLARAQQPDGRWSLGRFAGSGPTDVPELTSDTAATGLALLAFLGAGHDHFAGPHRDTVRRGLEFLLAVQKPDGDLYLPADELSNSCGWLYSHGIASIALCEAVGMTGDPLVRPAAAKACGFIASSQHPERGGWRYQPRTDADLSVSGWMLVALRSGALAGVETDPRTLAGVRTLLDAAAAADAPARYAYNPRKPDQRASELSGLCMTAVGALMRLHTGAKPDDPRVVAAARVLAARRPAYDVRNRDSYLWYYASQVLVHTGGADWDAWYAALVDTLAAAQETAGARAGSWDPLGPQPDRWGRWGGRIYVTALHLLALEVPDRRLPTYTAAE